METLLVGQKLDEEIAAVKRHLQALSSQKLRLQNDYVSSEEERPRRVLVPQIPLAEPPAPKVADASGSGSANINLTLKSLKPALTFALACPRTKSIAELKALLVETNPAAPPVEAQRWLFKGKALADGKLLQEYDAIQDGETVHMMVKAGVTPAPSAPTSFTEAAAPKSESPTDTTGSMPPPAVPAARAGHGHKGHPSLSMSIPKIIMDSDDATPFQPASDARASHRRSGSTSSAHSPHLGVTEAFRQVATSPEFWVGVRSFLEGEFSRAGPFGAEENARIMFEGWLGASKEWMTPSDIAKCREAAGISGMAGR